MSPPTPRLISLALSAFCASLAIGLLAGDAAALEAGEGAPPFTAPTLEGDSQLSLSSYRGKVVYLDFWASWCGPCATALPLLDALRKEFPSESFQVLAVNVDRNPEDARRFLARRPIGYPSVSDPEGSLPGRFGVETMPTSFLIDRDGTIRYVHRGFRKSDVDALRNEISALVERKRR